MADSRISVCRMKVCDNLAFGGMPYCLVCIELIREQRRCPDCASSVTVVIGVDDDDPATEPVVMVDVRHDASCIQWRRKAGGSHDDLITRTSWNDYFNG